VILTICQETKGLEVKKSKYMLLGDRIEQITKATGIKKIVSTITKDCGCADKKAKLNNPDLLINKILK